MWLESGTQIDDTDRDGDTYPSDSKDRICPARRDQNWLWTPVSESESENNTKRSPDHATSMDCAGLRIKRVFTPRVRADKPFQNSQPRHD